MSPDNSTELANAGAMRSPHPDPVPQPDEHWKTGTGDVCASLSRLLLDLYQLATSSPIGEFEDQLFQLLREHFSFDSAWLGKSTMIRQGPQMHNSYVHNLPEGYVADWEKVKDSDPIVPRVLDESRKAVIMSMAENSLTEQYRKFMSKYSIAQIVCGVSEDAVLKLWTHLSLYKNSLLPAFNAQDVELIQLAMPHIASALNLNRLHYMQQLKAAKFSPRASFAICDNQGVLQYADAAFADLMLMEWPEWNGAMLPRTFHKLQQENSSDPYVGKLISLQAEQVSDLLLINAKPRSAIDALTPRELAVARLFGEGMTYKAVAKKMEISPATVRHHLRQAYSKLNIQNKGEIAWLLSRYESSYSEDR